MSKSFNSTISKGVSEEIRERAHANGYVLSSKTEAILSTYDYSAQKRWVSNPIIERIIENIKWQILSNMQGNGNICVSNNKTTIINNKKPEIPNKKEEAKVEKKIESDSDSDGEMIGGFGLFD